MHNDREWADIRPEPSSAVGDAGFGILRITLLFGSLAIAIALFVAPVLDRDSRGPLTASIYGGLDRTATGTIGATTREYTIRRSVLKPGSTCIIHSNGIQAGKC
jgi:hypothetical protein